MRRKGSLLAEVIAISFLVLTTIATVVSSLTGSISMVERAREDFSIETARSEVLTGLISGFPLSGDIELQGGCILKKTDAFDKIVKYRIELEGIRERRGSFVCWPTENKGS